MAAIFNSLHPEVSGKEETFLEWKKLRTRHQGYIRNLANCKIIDDAERDHLMNLIDVCTLDEYKSFNLKGLRDRTLSIKSLEKRIRYPKQELGDKYKRRIIVTKPKRDLTEEDIETKDKVRFKNSVHRKYKVGKITLEEKKVLYEYANTNPVEAIRNHEYFPRAIGNTKIVKEKKISVSKKSRLASKREERLKREQEDGSDGSDNGSDSDTSVPGSSGGASESTDGSVSSSESDQSDSGECSVPVQRNRPVRRSERVRLSSKGKRRLV